MDHSSELSHEVCNQVEQKVHLIITSPPLPMDERLDQDWTTQNKSISTQLKKGNSPRAFEAQHKILDVRWKQAFAQLQEGGFLCVIARRSQRNIDGRHVYFDNASRISYACQKLGFDVLPGVLWRKPSNTPPHYKGSGMLPAGAYVFGQYDRILIFRKGTARSFDEEEKLRRTASALFCEERNNWYLDLWSDIEQSSLDIYLTDYNISEDVPLALYKRMIMMYSIQGDTVLDLFGANMKACIASIITKRNSISLTRDTNEERISIFSKRKLKAHINDQISTRVIDHMAYARTKDGLLLRYRNQPLGLPVQTQQEKHIGSYAIQSIKSDTGLIRVKYRKWKKAELQAMIKS